MSAFCGEEWNGSWLANGDLLPCIQSVIITDIPSALMCVYAGIRMLRIKQSHPSSSSSSFSAPLVSYRDLTPRVVFACCALLSFVSFAALIKFSVESPRAPYQLLQSGLAAVASLMVLLFVLMLRRRVLQLDIALRICWIIDFIASVKNVESAVSLLARGHALDDPDLLSFVRFPFVCVLFVYALRWNKWGLDDEANVNAMAEAEVSQLGIQNDLNVGLYHGQPRSPGEYAPVSESEFEEDEEQGQQQQSPLPTMGTTKAPSSKKRGSIWGRFLKFASGSNSSSSSNRRGRSVNSGSYTGVSTFSPAVGQNGPNRKSSEDYPHMSMDGVTHIDSNSFVRPPPTALIARSPMSPISWTRAHPQSHALYQSHVLITSFTESTVNKRSVVQFCLEFRIRNPHQNAISSSPPTDSSSALSSTRYEPIVVWKKYNEVEGLHHMLESTVSDQSDVTLPVFPPPYKAPYLEHGRTSLEQYLQAILKEPACWNDIANFIQLSQKLKVMREEAAAATIAAARRTGSASLGSSLVADSTVPASLSASPPSGGLSTSIPVRARLPSGANAVASNVGMKLRFDYSIIGVSVECWSRWSSTQDPALLMSGSASTSGANSPPGDNKSRRSSVTDETVKSKFVKDEEGNYIYTTFDIRVRTNRGEWNVRKQLAEIVKLRRDLLRLFPNFPVPSLIVEKDAEKDEATLNHARRVVEIFLQSVVGTSYFECAELYQLLAEPEANWRTVRRDKILACSDETIFAREQALAQSFSATISPSVAIPSASPQRSSSQGEHMSVGTTPKRSLREKKGGNSLASSMADNPTPSPLLSHSISKAEQSYFGSDIKDSSSPPTFASGTSVGSSPASVSRPRRKSSRSATSAGVLHHHATNVAGSYLDDEDGDFASRSGSSAENSDDMVSSDEELEEHEKGNGMNGYFEAQRAEHERKVQAAVAAAASSTGATESGQLPAVHSAVDAAPKRPDGAHRFTASITNWSFVNEEGKSSKSKHVVYTIVMREFIDLDNYLQWVVQRRFREFEALYKALKARFDKTAGIEVPPLPSKTPSLLAGRKPSMAFLDQRLQFLELFTQKILNTTAFQTDEFFSFFDMNKANREISMGSLQHDS